MFRDKPRQDKLKNHRSHTGIITAAQQQSEEWWKLNSEDMICNWKQSIQLSRKVNSSTWRAASQHTRLQLCWRNTEREFFWNCTSEGNQGISCRLVFSLFVFFLLDFLLKVCCLMQCLFLASNCPCSPLMSLCNPSLGTLSFVGPPGYDIWSRLLVPFPQFLSHLSIHPGRGGSFSPQYALTFGLIAQDKPDMLYCNLTQMYTSPWVCIHSYWYVHYKTMLCCQSFCLQGPYSAWRHLGKKNFCFKPFVQICEKRSNAAI